MSLFQEIVSREKKYGGSATFHPTTHKDVAGSTRKKLQEQQNKKQTPVPLPIPSPAERLQYRTPSLTERLQSGWDAEVEALQSPKVRYAGKSLSELDKARKRAGERVSSAEAQLERDSRVGKSGVMRGYRVGNVSANENEESIAKQRYDLASKRKAELDSYFNDRIIREDQEKRSDKIKSIVSNAVQNQNFKDIARRGAFAGEFAGNQTPEDRAKGAVAYINHKTQKNYLGYADPDAQNPNYDMNGATAFDRARYDTLTEDEKNVVRYYAALGDYTSVSEYLDAKEPILNARAQAKRNMEMKQFAEKHPIAGSAINIASVYGSASPYIANAIQMTKNAVSGEYVPTDKNSDAFANAHASNATAEGVGNAAYNAARDTFGSETAGNIARELSGIGLSIGQNAALLPLGKIGSRAAMTASAAGSNTLDALERGATPQQAFVSGTASGAIEWITEKMPIERIFNIAGTNPSGIKEIIKNVLKQSGIEASEEAISNVAGNIADRIIMGDKSNYEILISNLMKNGMSREDAEKEAFKQLYVVDTLKSAAGGALSGGVMGAGASAVGAARGRYAQNTANRAVDNAYSEMSKNGMFGENTQSAIDDAREKRLTARGYYADPDALQNRIDTVRENINREYDSLTDPLNKRMEEIESERSDMNAKLLPGGVLNANNDALAREYSRIKTMRDALEKQREQRLSELDNLSTDGYTDNKEGIANWSDENRAKLREFNEKTGPTSDTRTGEITDTANQSGTDAGGTSYMAFPPDQITTSDIYNIKNGEFPNIQQNNQASEKSGAFSMPENVENGSKIMDESVGAMVHDPNSYSALQGKYGTIEPGENPARVVDVPKQTSDDTKTRRFVRTAMESETTPDDFIPGIENMIKNGQFSYTPKSNEKSIRAALKKMKSIGFDAAVNEFRSKVDGNERIRAEDIALGELILAESGKLKNFELAKQTYLDLSILFTESGQVVQIASALKKMGPSGKYYFASKLVDRINKRIEKEGRVDASMERKNESIDLARNATKKAVKSVSKDMENISAEMWASKVGELLSNAIDKKKMVKEKTTIEHILSDLKKISRFYPKKQLKQAAKRRNVDTLRDYYANKEFYQKAWEIAQDKIREKYKGNEDELAVFDRFIHSTLEYSGGDAQVSIIALAINDIINEKYQNRKNFRNRLALGLTDFTKIADELVESLGVSGVDEQQIRNGVQRYFFTVKNLPNPNRLAKMISGALSKFGAQISKMLTQSATTKKELLVKVQKYLLETNNISHAEASIATDVIEKEFYRLLKSRSEKVLRNSLLEKDAPNITKKDALSVLEKYLNLGAFNDTELSDAAMKKITGYNGIIVPDDLLQKYANAETDEESNAAFVEIEKSIGEQIPADIFDKIDGWRYLSMLLNPLTHIRNLAGNTVSMPIRSVQNVVQTVMEKMIPKDSGMRTSAIKTNKEMRNLAEKYLDSILDATSSKYNDTNWRVNKYRKIFKTKWLEALRKFNLYLMEKEDMFAKKHAFKTAFARMAKANGWDIEFLESGTDDANSALQRLVSHATEKALESTFQEVNQIAENISRIKAVNRAIFNNGNFSAKAGQVSKYVAMNAMLPFVKTTLNITNQSARYSGAALIPDIIGTVSDVRAAGKNARTVAEATHLKQEALVNGLGKISGGLSGVGLMLTGALMAALNVLRVEGDDEKKNAFEHMQGEQNYSIKLGDQSITITWAQPIATPLLVGAELYKAFDRNEKNFNAYKVIETFTHVFDPITEMSFAKGALDTFNSIKHSKDNQISALLQSWATGYVNQFIPTIFGNIARTIDDTRRTTYSGFETNIEKNLKQNIVRKTVSKIPFASKTLEPYLDAWGREDFTQNPAWRVTKNFFEPWYRDTIYKTSVDAEIERLVSATSNDNLYPNSAPSSVSINDKTYYLMPEELTKYQKTMGQTAFNTLEKLFKNEKYKILSDEKKANIVSSIYDYSRALAQKEFVDGRSEITKEPDPMVSKVSGAVKAGIDGPTFFITRENLSDEDLGEQTAKKLDAQLRPEQSEYFKKKEDKNPDKIQYNSARKRRILMNSNFTPQQKAYLDKTLLDELERPIDYTDENSFYFSQMSDAKQKRWSDVTSRWSNMSKVDYYNIIDGISELGSHPKKAEVIAKLQTLGFGESGAYRFYAVAIAPKKK